MSDLLVNVTMAPSQEFVNERERPISKSVIQQSRKYSAAASSLEPINGELQSFSNAALKLLSHWPAVGEFHA